MSEPRHSAFVVATDAYADGRLRGLRAPAADAEALGRVLSDPQVGGFDVDVSLNEPEHVVRRRLSAFFEDRGLDDLLLLHLSCHGLKDEDGRLYFATADTELDHLEATAIPSDFVNRQMTRSRSRRIVLLLDCCYSGAFAAGLMSRGGDRVDLRERFDGRGRVVLTASSAMEYSFEGDHVAGEGKPSVFTAALVRGLESGEADRDRDGWISVDELYDYAFDEVRATTPSQTPGKWTFDVQGDLYVARSRLPAATEALPGELLAAAHSPFAHVRAGAVEELAGLARGPDEALAAPARALLDELASDDSRRVAEAVARATDAAPAPPQPAQPPPAQPALPPPAAAPVTEAVGTAVAAAAPRGPQDADAPVPPGAASLTRAAAAAVLAVLLLPFLAPDTADGWNLFAVLSPLEALGLAPGLWWLARGRAGASGTGGALMAAGALTAVGAAGLVKFAIQRLDGPALPLVAVVLASAACMLVAGRRCLHAAPAPLPGPPDTGALLLGLGGAGLGAISLFIAYDGYSSLWSEIADHYSAEFTFVPIASVLTVLVAITLLGTRPLTAVGALAATGALMVLHGLGIVLAAAGAVGEPGDVKGGGPLFAVAGALVLLGALMGRRGLSPARRSPSST